MFTSFVNRFRSWRGNTGDLGPWFNPPGSTAFYGKGVIIAPSPIKYDLFIAGQPTRQFNSLKEAMEAADSLNAAVKADAPVMMRERRRVG